MKTNEPILIQALRGSATGRIPVWYMRQAGRYLPEYNEIRRGRTFLELANTPDLAFEVSIQPHKRFSVDGIILFADILTPIAGAGIPLVFEEQKGPVLNVTQDLEKEISLTQSFDPSKTWFTAETIRRLRSYIDALPEASRPGLLGFAGAPFTLASYLIEGRTSKKFEKTKAMVFGDPERFHRLSDALTGMTIHYLKMQIDAGVDAVQIFDSWGGILSAFDYEEFSARYIKRIIEAIQPLGRPVIAFVGNSHHLLSEIVKMNPTAVSLDWRTPAADARKIIPASMGIQGNLDPLVLYGKPETVRAHTKRVLDGFKNRPGYVFNLGHGIHPATPIPCVEAMLETVRAV